MLPSLWFSFFKDVFTIFIVKHGFQFSQNDLVNVPVRSCCSFAQTPLITHHFPQIKSQSPLVPSQAQHELFPGKSFVSSAAILFHVQAAPGLNQISSHLRALVLPVPSACDVFFSGCTRLTPSSSSNLCSHITSGRFTGLLYQ